MFFKVPFFRAEMSLWPQGRRALAIRRFNSKRFQDSDRNWRLLHRGSASESRVAHDLAL